MSGNARLNEELATLRARVAELEQAARQRAATMAASPPIADAFRAVADSTYDLESWIDSTGRLRWVNPAVERLTGYSVAECLAMTDYPAPLIHEEDVAQVSAVFRDPGQDGSGNDLPFRLRTKDGQTRWAAVSWQPIYAADGTCLGRRSSIRDISDRQRAEEALLEERRLLTSIIAHIPSGVFWKGRDFRYRGCNEAFARSAGVARPEDIIGRTDYELAWEKDQADYFRTCDLRVMSDNHAMLNIEEVERQADGRQAILLTSKVPLHDPQGQVSGLLGIDTDISHLKEVENELRQIRTELERRVEQRTAELSGANQRLRREIAERARTQEALRASEERYRLVSELTSDYAYAFRVEADGACHVEWITDAFARITGHAPSDIEDAGWTALVHPDDRPATERRIRVLLSGRPAVSEFRILTRDGRVCWLCDHARPIWDDALGRVTRILGAAQDITARQQAEEESRRHLAALAHVARLTTLGEMAAQLAHELNQPLCTMVGNAQTAQRLLAAPEPNMDELRAALNDIVTFGRHAAAVIRQMREFIRRQQPQPAVLNVQRMIEEIADFLEADARQHSARLRFEIADRLPTICGDPIQLQQVVMNLVRNGLEAVSRSQTSRREVVIRASARPAEGVVISVTDAGPGLDPEVAERLFEPFFTTKPTGLGLGLPISRSVVEAHGGRLWAEANVGPGTTFSLLLPANTEETR